MTSCCNDIGVKAFDLPDVSAIYNGTAWAEGFSLASNSTIQRGQLPETSNSGPSNETKAHFCNPAELKIGLGTGLGVGLPLFALLASLFCLFIHQKRVIRDLNGMQQPIRPIVGQPWHIQKPESPSPPRDEPPYTVLGSSELQVDPNDGRTELSAIG